MFGSFFAHLSLLALAKAVLEGHLYVCCVRDVEREEETERGKIYFLPGLNAKGQEGRYSGTRL